MARIRPSKQGQDNGEPGPGGAEPPVPGKKKGKKSKEPKAQARPRQQPRNEKAGSVTKSVQEGRSRRFFGEMIAELKKVTWPNRAQLFSATAVVIIFVALYVIRGLPTWFLYRRALPNVGERTRFSLYVATGLPIIIALVTVEIADGVMTERSGSALIGAGALTVLVFPLVGDIIARRQRRTSGSTGSDQDRAAKTA